MHREGLPAVLTAVVGTAVLGTLGHTIAGPGNYYHFPALSVTSPGMAEVAVVATALTGGAAVVVGTLGVRGYHPRASVVSTLLAVAVLARPLYASVAYADLAFTVTGLVGVVVLGPGAIFVALVEGRRVLSRWRRAGRSGDPVG